MRLLQLGTAITLVALATGGCKARRSTSSVRDVNAAQKMNSSAGEIGLDPNIDGRIPVLIYYANDTHYSVGEDKSYANLMTLVTAINSGLTDPKYSAEEKAYLAQASKRLTDDWTAFLRAVDRESAGLQAYVCKENARYKMGLAIFRNSAMSISRTSRYETTRNVNWFYCNPKGKTPVVALTAKDWSISWFNDFRYDSQPLSKLEVFRSALQEVRDTFEGEGKKDAESKYIYILVTKSHGSAEMSITPNLVIDAGALSQSDITKALIQHKNAKSATGAQLEDFKTLMPTLSSFNGVNAALSELAQSAEGEFSAEQIGVTKREYLRTLSEQGGGDPKRGMYFPLVFMEACNSQLQSSSDEWIQETINIGRNKVSYAGLNLKNIGLMFTSDARGLAYQTLNYPNMFTELEYARFDDFPRAFNYQLEEVRRKQAANAPKPAAVSPTGK